MILRSVLGGLNLETLGMISLSLAVIGFLAVVVWTLSRPRQRIEADARLWMDDEKD